MPNKSRIAYSAFVLLIALSCSVLTFAGQHKSIGMKKVQKISDQARLADIAVHDIDGMVRRYAFSRLTDQTQLAYVVRKSADYEMRQLGVHRITDPALLADLAENEADPGISRNALNGIADQPTLVSLAWRSATPLLRRAAAEKITDAAALAEVARHHPDVDIRMDMAKRLADQSVLADMARHDANASVRLGAIGRLTDQTVLSEIATTGGEEHLRLAAVRLLTRQDLLARLSLESNDRQVRGVATARLTDQTALAEIARRHSDPELRRGAIKKLTAPAVLRELALGENDPLTRSTAVSQMVERMSATLACPASPDGITRWRAAARSSSSVAVKQDLWLGVVLPAPEESQIVTGIVGLASDTLRVLGYRSNELKQPARAMPVRPTPAARRAPASSGSPAPASAVEVLVAGLPEGADYRRQGSTHLPAAFRWSSARAKGLVRLTLDGQCVYSRTFDKRESPPGAVSSNSFRQATSAPVGSAVHYALIGAVLDMALNLGNEQGDNAGEQKILSRIATNSAYTELSKEALSQLKDQSALARIARQKDDLEVRKAAVSRLDDQAVLAEIACDEFAAAFGTAEIAVQRLADQAALIRVARCQHNSITLRAIQKLNDRAVLSDLAEHDPIEEIRQAARERLHSLDRAK